MLHRCSARDRNTLESQVDSSVGTASSVLMRARQEPGEGGGQAVCVAAPAQPRSHRVWMLQPPVLQTNPEICIFM